MKKINTLLKQSLIALTLCLIASYGNAQSSITIDASQNMTNFKFTDSQGNVDENYNPLFSGAYSLGYRYKFDFGLITRANLGMRKAGATYVYDNMNYSWDLQYFSASIGVGYMYDFDRISPYLTVSPYFAQLLRANQRLNNEDFDILRAELLENKDFGLFITPGVNYRISDYISTYLEFNYMLGLNNLETNDVQESRNIMIGGTLGLSFNIK